MVLEQSVNHSLNAVVPGSILQAVKQSISSTTNVCSAMSVLAQHPGHTVSKNEWFEMHFFWD